MLEGLQAFEQSTRGRESLARAAAIAFGFVYLHPMSDGNGRIHRFLINDTLLRDQAIPAGVILPVSATITSVREFGHGYDRVLEVFSRPFMRRYDAAYRFGQMSEYEDGVRSNFVFDAYDDANAAWRYPDLTEHAIYTAQLVATRSAMKWRTKRECWCVSSLRSSASGRAGNAGFGRRAHDPIDQGERLADLGQACKGVFDAQ